MVLMLYTFHQKFSGRVDWNNNRLDYLQEEISNHWLQKVHRTKIFATAGDFGGKFWKSTEYIKENVFGRR